MSDDLELTGTVTGDDLIQKGFADFDSNLRAQLRRFMADAGQQLVAGERSLIPHGKTGDISASVRAFINESNNKISLSVRPTDYRGYFVDQGTGPGVESVTRRVKSRDVRTIVGSVSMRHGLRVFTSRRKITSKGSVTYQRHFHTQAHPFAAPTYEALIGRIQDSLYGLVSAAAAAV